MAKEQFLRHRIHDEYMKQIIIRLDYVGVRGGAELVRLFDKRFPKAFKQSQDVYNSEYSISLRHDEIKDISDSSQVPINMIQKEKITRYKGMNNVACNVSLDISQYYLCMIIECDSNYDGLDKYIECFKGAITIFSENIPYFQPKRLGLRKIRVESKPAIADFNNVFENFVFNIPNYSFISSVNLKSEYFDFIEYPQHNNLRINIHRTIERHNTQNAAGSLKTEYRASLDIDVYYKDEKLSRINELLTQANSVEFDVYKSCMNEEYLKSIYR